MFAVRVLRKKQTIKNVGFCQHIFWSLLYVRRRLAVWVILYFLVCLGRGKNFILSRAKATTFIRSFLTQHKHVLNRERRRRARAKIPSPILDIL